MRIALARTATLAVFVLLVIPVLASAQCTDLFENLAEDGNNYFGRKDSGQSTACGESVTLDCDFRIQEVRFRLILAGPAGSVPPLAQGDIIQGALLDMDGNVLSMVELAIPHSSGTAWMDFDFSGDATTYPAGDYIVAIATEVAGVGYVPMDTNSGFAGGTRWGSPFGLAGPWTQVPSWDYTFSLTVDTDPTAVAETSWGAVKMRFHEGESGTDSK